MRKNWKVLLALLAIFSLIAAACGDDDDESSSTEEATEEPAEEAAEEPAEEEAAEEEAAAEEEEAAEEEAGEEEEAAEEPADDGSGALVTLEEECAGFDGLQAPEGFTVNLVTDIGKVDDGTFNQFAYEGLQGAIECFGIENSSFIETVSEAELKFALLDR